MAGLGRLRGRSDTGDKTRGGGTRLENAQVPGVSVGSQIHTNSGGKKKLPGAWRVKRRLTCAEQPGHGVF